MHVESIPIRDSMGVLRSLVKATPAQRQEFMSVYRLYRRYHSMRYSARIADGIVFKGLAF